MFEPITPIKRKNLKRFRQMAVGEVRILNTKSKAQAMAILRARMERHPHEVYALDATSIPFLFRRDA